MHLVLAQLYSKKYRTIHASAISIFETTFNHIITRMEVYIYGMSGYA